jgi:hypothetical protein
MLSAPVTEGKREGNSPDTVSRAASKGRAIAATSAERRRQHFRGLQRTIGNQAVSRMLSLAAPTVQTKLTVNQPGDQYEQEADRVADQVMRMPEPSLSPKCAKFEEEEKNLQRKEADSGPAAAPPIVPASGSPASASAAPETVDAKVREMISQPGQALDPRARAFLEPRFGFDFSNVRVHTGRDAGASATSVHAKAYTMGSNVVFGPGQYSPDTQHGRRLIAHELAHVVQQSGSECAKRSVADTPPVSLSAAENRIQREADNPGAAPPADAAAPVTWTKGPTFPPALELPYDEAARRVNSVLDAIGASLTYVKRPPMPDLAVASADASKGAETVQTFPDGTLQRAPSKLAAALAKVHGGVVGSLQICWDCLTGEASFKGWIWAGAGYEAPVIGWVGGYWFGEKTWWQGNAGKWFEAGTCAPGCEPSKSMTETGFGVAGFPIDIKPKQKASVTKVGVEVGALLTPHSFCDADLEFIALFNVLGYLGPVGAVLIKAVTGLNTLTKDSPHFSLEAGIDISATFHLCRGANSLMAVSNADFCGGGFIGAGVGLSHEKNENHGAV